MRLFGIPTVKTPRKTKIIHFFFKTGTVSDKTGRMLEHSECSDWLKRSADMASDSACRSRHRQDS